MQETNATTLAKKERDLFVSKSELAAATKELGALKVRDQDSLGKAHEEDLWLNAQTVVLNDLFELRDNNYTNLKV